MSDPHQASRGIQAIEDRWRSLGTTTLIRQTWPKEESISAMQALQRWAPAEYDQLALRYAVLQRFGAVPIVAVAGLLNSGKSSLTASFLDENSRARVLRGFAHEQGSQRFTLWLPKDWKEDASFYKKILELLTRVFAQEPEELAEDPEQARHQQNDVSALARPLVACDTQLSRLGVALLDCPDIQRAQSETFRTRLDVVSRASELCVAVIVVFARSQMEISDLAEILARLPEARRIYAINLIRREPAHIARQEAAMTLNLDKSEAIYGAYDFLSNSYETRAPQWDWNLGRDRQTRQEASQPCFFELSDDEAQNEPAAVAEDRSMLALGQKFSPLAMQSQRAQELGRTFFVTLRSALDVTRKEHKKEAHSLSEAQDRLASSCRELLSQGDTLRLKMSPEIVASIEASLSRTANFYYKWFLLPPRRFVQGATKLFQKGIGLASLKGDLQAKKEELERKIGLRAAETVKAGAIGVEILGKTLSLWSGYTGDFRTPDFWKKDAETILTRFVDEDKSNLSDAEWDAITSALWEQIPRRARIQIFSSVFLLLGSLAIAFFDGGVSFITLKAADLFGAVGLAASLGINLQGSSAFQKTLEEKLGLQQVANFHAIACDVIGLPRSAKDLPLPTVPEKAQWPSYGASQRQWSQWEILEPALSDLRDHAF